MHETAVTFSDELKEHFRKLNVEFPLFPDTATKKFKSLESFYLFVKKEFEYWDPCASGMLANTRNHFFQIKTNLENAINQSDFNNAKNFLTTALQMISYNRNPFIFSNTEIGMHVKNLYEKSYLHADGFLSYLYGQPGYQPMQQASFNNKEFVTGVFYGLSFENPELAKTLTEEERESRLNSIQSLQEMVNHSITDLSEETARIQEVSKNEELQIKQLQETFIVDRDTLLSESKQKITDFENLYKEKLRLAAPAQYWETTKNSYRKNGIIWTFLAVGCSGIFLWIISMLISSINKETLHIKEITKALTFASVRDGILLTVFISIGLFLVNFFIKLAISSFHLSRDANERLQLTHLYLSLIEEKAVTTDERAIVLQSLFSRADTGLLKGDSSPTIPDSGLIGQLIKLSKPS